MRLVLSFICIVCLAVIYGAIAGGCAGYTATQTRQCVQAGIEAARADIAAIRQCLNADDGFDECIAKGADGALASTDAVLVCLPPPAAPPVAPRATPSGQ